MVLVTNLKDALNLDLLSLQVTGVLLVGEIGFSYFYLKLNDFGDFNMLILNG